MSGNDAVLTDDERNALRRAKELTGTSGPGYPMPTYAPGSDPHPVRELSRLVSDLDCYLGATPVCGDLSADYQRGSMLYAVNR